MPPKIFVDLESIDFSNIEVPIEEIRKVNMQRYEMEQLDGIVKIFWDEQIMVGYRDVKEDEFWIRGHIPGRPLFPGILMVEAAGQLASYAYKIFKEDEDDRFLGYGGLENVKFRGTVHPGQRLILIAKKVKIRSRMAIFDVQAAVEDKLVFEGTIIGITV